MGKQNNVWILSAKASYSDTKVVEGYSWDFLPPTKCIWFKWTPNSLPSCRGIFFILKVNSSHSWNSKQKVNMEGAREASLNLILYLLQWQKVIFLKPKGASLFSFSLQAWKQRSEEAPCFKAGRVLSIWVESCCSRQLVSFHKCTAPLKARRKKQDGMEPWSEPY